jgi:hypothetical protein
MSNSKRSTLASVVTPLSGLFMRRRRRILPMGCHYPSTVANCKFGWETRVAISCNEAKKEENATWFPWKDNEPWSAVQVMALYKTKAGQYKMDVRWFWRYKEFPTRYAKFFKDSIPTKNTLLFNSVVESNTLGSVPIHYIMGRVLLTSQEKCFTQFYNETTTERGKPVPVVAGCCAQATLTLLRSPSF